jgi:hypothetical protein
MVAYIVIGSMLPLSVEVDDFSVNTQEHKPKVIIAQKFLINTLYQ